MNQSKDLHAVEESLSFNIKRHYASLKGINVPLDYFIYTCFEEEQNLKAMSGALPQGFKRHPQILSLGSESDFAQQAAFLEKPFFDIADHVCSWYTETYPIFLSKDPIDYHQHAKLLYPLVALLFDLQALYHKKEGQGKFPRYEVLTAEHAETTDISDHQKDPYSSNFWKQMEQLILKHMPTYASQVIAYMRWYYGCFRQKHYDLKSLPPIGRYLSLLKKSAFSRKTSHQEQNFSKQNSKTFDQQDKEQMIDEAALKEAIDAAIKAIETLKTDSAENSITLLPQNSYVRRRQHKEIVAAGFESLSVGEGKERAVQIRRK